LTFNVNVRYSVTRSCYRTHTDGMTTVINKSGQPAHPALSRLHDLLRKGRSRDPDHVFEKAALDAQVIIIEGISGAGKDTLQKYLKKKLNRRVVHDYSEGEVLHSWKQSQIDGIYDVRIKFMKAFVNYIRGVIQRDNTAVFLLNRFHLSTYAWRVIEQRELGREYKDIVTILKSLPVHIFILHVDENEIEQRSLHPERSAAWQKFQRQILKSYSFYDRLRMQQNLILEAAATQQIPYSVIKLNNTTPEIRENAQIRILEKPNVLHPDAGHILDRQPSLIETKIAEKLARRNKRSRKMKVRHFSNPKENDDGSYR